MNLPVHPVFVHFPIAIYFMELFCLFLSRKDESYLRFARLSFWVAFFGTLAALASGFWDTGGFEGIVGPVKKHFYAAIAVTVIQVGRALYWKFSRQPQLNILLWSSMAGYAAVILAAFYGGEVVYA